MRSEDHEALVAGLHAVKGINLTIALLEQVSSPRSFLLSVPLPLQRVELLRLRANCQPFPRLPKLSPAAQISLALETNIMLGLHGAGFTHMIWMKRGSALIEGESVASRARRSLFSHSFVRISLIYESLIEYRPRLCSMSSFLS